MQLRERLPATFSMENLSAILSFDARGKTLSLTATGTGRSYSATDSAEPAAFVRKGGREYGATWAALLGRRLVVQFDDAGARAVIGVTAAARHRTANCMGRRANWCPRLFHVAMCPLWTREQISWSSPAGSRRTSAREHA